MAALFRLIDAGQNGVLLELHCPSLLVHRQHAAADQFPRKDLGTDDAAGARRPQTFGKLRMHRHCDGGVALTFLGCDLDRHLAHDLAQVWRPKAMRIPEAQERVVEDVKHQPRLGAERPLRPIPRHVLLGPGEEAAALARRLRLA
ncbi:MULTISPECIES: hypothetical protein [unclassified Bradyrhizobium]|uniref:hypothetical protein n=1 Tax=unclassified Bradyrhizobium TaxID=2631580 RepID=UPI0029167838|nr:MULTISPECIES: hypothetical protein [unclassified Bradyrhizobium]